MEIRQVATVRLGMSGAGIAEASDLAAVMTQGGYPRGPLAMLADHATARLAFHAGGSAL